MTGKRQVKEFVRRRVTTYVIVSVTVGRVAVHRLMVMTLMVGTVTVVVMGGRVGGVIVTGGRVGGVAVTVIVDLLRFSTVSIKISIKKRKSSSIAKRVRRCLKGCFFILK